jgi:hypothetical protein
MAQVEELIEQSIARAPPYFNLKMAQNFILAGLKMHMHMIIFEL